MRSDKGQKHNYAPERLQRVDKGQRHNYTVSAKVLQSRFEQALLATALRDEFGEIIGEGASRDENDIFDFKIVNKWRTITRPNGQKYKTKTKLSKPLEQFRWEWLRQLAQEGNPTPFCKRYFILLTEWEDWTFTEWCNAYTEVFGGRENYEDTKLKYWADDEHTKQIIYCKKEESDDE